MRIGMLGVWSAVAAIGLVVAVGCSQQNGDRERTYQVSGTVTHNGQPVDGAQVVFLPVGGGQSAVGTTDEAGRYTMTTYDADDGAVAGEYNVKITKLTQRPSQGTAVDESSEGYTGQEADDHWVPKNLLPARYADANASGLKATVTEGTNTIDFELTD